MQINILNNKNWYIKVINSISKLNRILFYIITNKIIYNLVIKLYEIL